jgi:hypothetical protein
MGRAAAYRPGGDVACAEHAPAHVHTRAPCGRKCMFMIWGPRTSKRALLARAHFETEATKDPQTLIKGLLGGAVWDTVADPDHDLLLEERTSHAARALVLTTKRKRVVTTGS